MNVIQSAIPRGFDGYDSTPIPPEDLESVTDLGVQEVRYWYGAACYEGAGHMLLQKDGQWYHHDMGHCSCYGPLCHLDLFRPFDTLGDLLASCSQELKRELELLVE